MKRKRYERQYNAASPLREAPSEDPNAMDIDVQTWQVFRNDWEIYTAFTEKGANDVAKFMSAQKDSFRRAPQYKYRVEKATMPQYINHKTKVELERAGVEITQFEGRRR